MAANQAFTNVSGFTLAKLKASSQGQRLRDDFIRLFGRLFAQRAEILTKFNFSQPDPEAGGLPRPGLSDRVSSTPRSISPLPVKDADGRIKLPALDNHGMGTVFEELIRRFNEENNEEAGEHFTPRDVGAAMAKLLFLPVADRIESAPIRCTTAVAAPAACLTVAEEALRTLAEAHGKDVSIHLSARKSATKPMPSARLTCS